MVFVAAVNGSENICSLLINSLGLKLKDLKTEYAPLYSALEKRDLYLLDMLIEKFATLKSRKKNDCDFLTDAHPWTPLHYAV